MFPPVPDDPEPSLDIYGVGADGQTIFISSVAVSPFPDWEWISRKVMRVIVLASQGKVE